MEFILILSSLLLLTTRTAGANPVLDIDGNELRRGNFYYATSATSPNGGVVTTAIPPCPPRVAQWPLADAWSGAPITFIPENPEEDTVREGNTLYVSFVDWSIPLPGCSRTTLWKDDGLKGYVTTGGTKSTSIGPHDSRFAIRKAAGDGSSSRDYIIEACPCSVGAGWPSCKVGCHPAAWLHKPSALNFIKTEAAAYPDIRSVLSRPSAA